jgi:hypothetical protein
MSDLEGRLEAILRAAPTVMEALTLARDLDLPDWLLFSGAVYQPVWNALTGRPPDHGIKDYDLGYFDDRDLSWEAEDEVIRRVALASPPALAGMVEVRNQARVHLWFEDHFGDPYSPLRRSAEALERFASPAFAVGARLEAEDEITILAPFGLEEVFAMRIGPNPTRPAPALAKIVAALRARWPEITMEE